MIFIDFGLLPSPYCKISYLLAKSADVTQIIVGLMVNFGQVFYQMFTNVFLNIFFHLFTFLTFLYFLSERLLHLCAERRPHAALVSVGGEGNASSAL